MSSQKYGGYSRMSSCRTHNSCYNCGAYVKHPIRFYDELGSDRSRHYVYFCVACCEKGYATCRKCQSFIEGKQIDFYHDNGKIVFECMFYCDDANPV